MWKKLVRNLRLLNSVKLVKTMIMQAFFCISCTTSGCFFRESASFGCRANHKLSKDDSVSKFRKPWYYCFREVLAVVHYEKKIDNENVVRRDGPFGRTSKSSSNTFSSRPQPRLQMRSAVVHLTLLLGMGRTAPHTQNLPPEPTFCTPLWWACFGSSAWYYFFP